MEQLKSKNKLFDGDAMANQLEKFLSGKIIREIAILLLATMTVIPTSEANAADSLEETVESQSSISDQRSNIDFIPDTQGRLNVDKKTIDRYMADNKYSNAEISLSDLVEKVYIEEHERLTGLVTIRTDLMPSSVITAIEEGGVQGNPLQITMFYKQSNGEELKSTTRDLADSKGYIVDRFVFSSKEGKFSYDIHEYTEKDYNVYKESDTELVGGQEKGIETNKESLSEKITARLNETLTRSDNIVGGSTEDLLADMEIGQSAASTVVNIKFRMKNTEYPDRVLTVYDDGDNFTAEVYKDVGDMYVRLFIYEGNDISELEDTVVNLIDTGNTEYMKDRDAVLVMYQEYAELIKSTVNNYTYESDFGATMEISRKRDSFSGSQKIDFMERDSGAHGRGIIYYIGSNQEEFIAVAEIDVEFLNGTTKKYEIRMDGYTYDQELIRLFNKISSES